MKWLGQPEFRRWDWFVLCVCVCVFGICLWERVPFFSLFVPFPKAPLGQGLHCRADTWALVTLRCHIVEQEALG